MNLRPSATYTPALVWIAVGVAALVAAVAVLAATRLGAGATPDTGHYLATAGNLLTGRGFVRLGPEVMASWPPLYPSLLAVFGALGIQMLTGARILNAVALALSAGAAAYWVSTATRSSVWGAAAGLGVALAPPLVYAGTLALTDAPFAALQVLALWQLARWLREPRRSALIACIVWMALACLMRYNGVVLIATAVLAILAFAPLPLAARFRHAVVAGALSAAPLALWFARNFWLTGTVAGPRVPSEYPLVDAVADAGYTVMSWFVPYRVLLTDRLTGALLLAALLGALAVVAWRGRRQPEGPAAVVCVTFLAIFLPFMILTFTRVAVDPLSDRMLAPAYIPLVVAALACASVLAGWWGAPAHGGASGHGVYRRVVPLGLAFAILLVLAVAASRTRAIVAESRAEGPGGAAHSNFNTERWRSSPTLQWAGMNLRGRLVFASAPAALYIATGIDARPMPRKHARRSPGIPHDDLEALRAEVAQAGEAFLVVSEGHVPGHTFSLDELSAAFIVEPLRSFPDGQVYRLTTRSPAFAASTIPAPRG